MTDLDKLIAAVEAGDMWSETQYAVFGNGTDLVNAYQAAFDGSLDAAIRLHESLLPGWVWNVVDSETTVWPGYPGDPKDYQTGYAEGRPARAWLLAVLKALQAQSTPPISPEEAQFNAVRYHERFGPLDEHGNPVDPRRRG
jgi:hypothetical protein